MGIFHKVFLSYSFKKVSDFYDQVQKFLHLRVNYVKSLRPGGGWSEEGIAKAKEHVQLENYQFVAYSVIVLAEGLLQTLANYVNMYHTARETGRQYIHKTLDGLESALSEFEVNITKCPSYSEMKKLILLSNSLKHGQGSSLDALFQLEPQLFVLEKVRVFFPITTRCFKLDSAVFARFRLAYESFLDELE